ncbi:tyrosine-type recombinase/integrase [Burkholderia plantarii]|nr:tyrosine-type recombinase/integrase [Burkholderia plantarii]
MRARHRVGGKIYYYYDHGGKPRREEPLGSDFVAAVRRWSEIEQAQVPATAAPTLADAFTAYMRDVLPRKARRTQEMNLAQFAFLAEFFEGAALDDIEPIHVKQYMHWRHKKSVAWFESKNRTVPHDAGYTQANHEFGLLSHVFNFAREVGMTKAPNPCSGVKKYSLSGRDVYVEDDLYRRLYAEADQPTRDAMDLAYLTGQRPQDTLSHDERDIRDNFLHIDQGKTGKKLRMEISGELKALIDRIRARKAGYKVVSTVLIVNERGERMTLDTLQRRFREARRRAGIGDSEFQFRDLRAKAGTDKTDSTGDIRQAQKQLGHTTIGMTEHYVRNRRGDKVKPTR